MRKYLNYTQWALFWGLTVGLATAELAHAGQPKDKLDLEAEAQQAAQEEAKEAEDRLKGIKPQRLFSGTFVRLSDPSESVSADVLGSFVTDKNDTKPGRAFLVKVDSKNKGVLDAIMSCDRKKTQVTGKLRVLGPDGEAKYLIVTSVIPSAPTPPAKERRSSGGL